MSKIYVGLNIPEKVSKRFGSYPAYYDAESTDKSIDGPRYSKCGDRVHLYLMINGNLDGMEIKYNATTENLISVCEWKAGAREGHQELYHSNGTLQKSFNVVGFYAVRNGFYREWDVNGVQTVTLFYEHGKLVPTLEAPLDIPIENVPLVAPKALPQDHSSVSVTVVIESDAETYKAMGTLAAHDAADNLNGLRQAIDDDGERIYQYSVISKQKNGPEFSWFSGKLFIQRNWLGGKLHGVQRVWHSNGRLESETHYVTGIKHGPCREWSKKGELLSDSAFYNDNQCSADDWRLLH